VQASPFARLHIFADRLVIAGLGQFHQEPRSKEVARDALDAFQQPIAAFGYDLDSLMGGRTPA
jgi:hypothetical protein